MTTVQGPSPSRPQGVRGRGCNLGGQPGTERGEEQGPDHGDPCALSPWKARL